MDAANDPRVERVIGMMSAQVGKTETLLNITGYHVHHDPAPMLILQPTLGLAEAFSKDRLAPMFRDTPALKSKLGAARSRDGENTLLHKKFAGGHVTMAGANSPSSLASRPIRVFLGDEIDRYPRSAGKEGDPVKLATKRTTTFWNRKIVLFSTPTLKGASRIDDEWEASDQRRWLMPCPSCAHPQHFRWEQVRYKAKLDGTTCDPKTVRYECESCRYLIGEHEKAAMVRAGAWVATYPDRRVAGFHLNELYSPWKRWVEVIDDYLEAKDDPEKLKVWWNTSLGLPFEVQGGDAPAWQKLYDRREPYPLGTVPQRAVLLTAAVDVQIDRVEYKIVGWNREESWVVFRGVVFGDTATLVPFEEVEAEIFRDWPHASGQHMRVRKLAVDTGFNTKTVYKWVRTLNSRIVMAVKGRALLEQPIALSKAVDVNTKGTKRVKRGARLWGVGVNILKPDLYARLKKAKPTDSVLAERGYPSNFVHFPELDEEYFRQLTAEELIMVPQKNGHAKPVWFKKYPANEALDLMIYNMAAYHGVGADRWSEEKWSSLETQYAAPAKAPTRAPKATTPTPPEKMPDSQAPAEQTPKEKQAPKPAASQPYGDFWKSRR